MLGRDVLVFEVGGFLEGLLQRFVQRLAQARLRGRTGHARQFFLDAVQVALEALGGHTNLFEHGGDHALAVLDERQQQVHGLQLGVAQLGGARLRLLNRLLRLHGEFVKTNGHKTSVMSSESDVVRNRGSGPFRRRLFATSCSLLALRFQQPESRMIFKKSFILPMLKTDAPGKASLPSRRIELPLPAWPQKS